MRRTITLPDELDRLLRLEAKRRDTTFSELARTALAEHVGLDGRRRRVGFAALGDNPAAAPGADAEDVLGREWTGDFDRDR